MKTLGALTVAAGAAMTGYTTLEAVAQQISPKAQDPQIQPSQPEQTPIGRRRKFRMRLTLSEPGDLRIREGDTLKAGQVVADRVNDRMRLMAQKAQIELNLKQLGSPILAPVPLKPIPALAKLPEPLYLPQWTEIDYQRLKVSESEEAKIAQLRKVEALKTLEGLDPAVFEHEASQTRELEAQYSLAISQLKKAEAALELAKREQAQAEYLFRLEESKRAIAVQQQELERSRQLAQQRESERDRAFKTATLKQQIITIDNQIAQIASIKTPYDAKVQRVKFAEQNDNRLIVDVVLAITDSRTIPQPESFTTPESTRPSGTTKATGKPKPSTPRSGAIIANHRIE